MVMVVVVVLGIGQFPGLYKITEFHASFCPTHVFQIFIIYYHQYLSIIILLCI